MTKHPDRDQEHTEASPPTKPAAPLTSINEPQAPSVSTGDLPSINEPPGPSNDPPPSPAQVTDVSRETRPETDHGNKRHR